MGAIFGEASNRIVCLDLDTIKNPEAAEWWRGPDHGRELRPGARDLEGDFGSGGRHLSFRYPPGFAMPTVKTSIGVDMRGQGGFIVLPPSHA